MPVTNPPIANQPFVTTSSLARGYGIGEELWAIGANTASQIWPAANRAIYMPLYIDRPCTVVKLWVTNAATVSGNLDVGIYDSTGTSGTVGAKLVSSGSTAQSGASAVQEFDITDTALTRGVYWLGMSASSGTATYFGTQPNVTTYLGMWGILQEAAALPLPATATPVAAASPIVPVIGIAFRTLVA